MLSAYRLTIGREQMTQEEFRGLAHLHGSRVELRFVDRPIVVATLLSVSVDCDGSQHLVYETSENAPVGKKAIYVPGEEVLSCVPSEEV